MRRSICGRGGLARSVGRRRSVGLGARGRGMSVCVGL